MAPNGAFLFAKKSEIVLLITILVWYIEYIRKQQEGEEMTYQTMTDKNGIEMKTGMIVEIKNAFFKNDNGRYVIEHTPGDPTWSGNDYSLRRIKRNGELAKTNPICFWPICTFVSDKFKNAEAKAWNTENATIETIGFKNMDPIKEHFAEEADKAAKSADYYRRYHGQESTIYKHTVDIQKHYEAIAASL